MKIKILFVVTTVLFFITCKHQPPGPVPDNTSPYCFQTDVLPIFQTNCAKVGCHDAVTHEKGYNFTSYTTVMKRGVVKGNPNASEIYTCLSGYGEDRMPQDAPPLTAYQQNLIRRWIADGCKNDTCEGSCDSTQFAYTANIAPIMNTYCKGCHNASNAQKNVDCSSYPKLSLIVADGRLMKSINHTAGVTAMPYNMPKLDDCRIAQIRKWIQDGAKNN